jgi:PAS domain S-box-containing protein
VDIKQTGAFSIEQAKARLVAGPGDGVEAHRAILGGLPIPSVLLKSSGIVVAANREFAELLQVDAKAIEGEPLLTWIGRAGDREAFGREFMDLRKRPVGFSFVRELDLVAALGPHTSCSVRANKLSDSLVLVSASRAAERGDPHAELGRAVTRALDALDQGVLLVSHEARIVHANPAARGLLQEGLVGRGFLELAHPSQVDDFARALKLARAGSWHGEVDLLGLDGEPIPVELSIAAGTGEGAPAVVLFRDLRSRRRRQFDERLTQQVLRSLISSPEPRDAAAAAIGALATGLSSLRAVLVTHFGGGWERWTAKPDEPATFERLAPGVRPPKTWLEREKVDRIKEPTDELEELFGEFDPREAAARVTLRATGGVVGHLLVGYDRRKPWGSHEFTLIDQLATQLALGLANGLLMLETRALANYQSRVLDQSAVLLNSVDAQGRIVTWNRASEKLIGLSVAEAEGKRFGVEAAPAVDAEKWAELWEQLLREGVITTQATFLDAQGDEIPLHLEGRVLREGRAVTGAVLVGLDLRQRKALENQVLRTQKLAAVGLLAAGIAHEINNPLTGVVGYSKLLLEKKLPPDVRERVERIAASGERCRKIVEGVLLFSRQQGGVKEKVDLRDVIERVSRIGEYQWKMHNVRIIRDAPESVEVMADREQIEQVLLNLLSNAVDAMTRGGTVHVALTRLEDGSGSLAVTDQGSGIPEEIQASIFDPFFSTKEIGKGTGLGLAISYGIVRDHGGDILVRSTLGQGTTFTVILPPDGKARTDAEEDGKTSN